MNDTICTICLSTDHRAHACPHQMRLFDLADTEPASDELVGDLQHDDEDES